MREAGAERDDATDSGDRRLVEQARRGDVAAFEALYRRHAGRVNAVCRRVIGRPERAEDAVQEVFLRVWQRLESFRGESAFSTWLHRLAINVAIDHVRAETRRRGREIADEEVEGYENLAPVRPAATGARDLEDAIASLPPGARIVFVLHDVEGYRHEEIAERTGIAPGTCRAQLHRARRLLRERLER